MTCGCIYIFEAHSLEGKEQRAGEDNQEQCEIEDASVRRRHQEAITVKLVATGENFPFARDTGTWRHCPTQQIHLGWRLGGYCWYVCVERCKWQRSCGRVNCDRGSIIGWG